MGSNSKFWKDSAWNIFAAAVPVFSTVFSLGVFFRNLHVDQLADLMIFYAIIGALTISDFGVGRITCTRIIVSVERGVRSNGIIANGLLASTIVSAVLFLLSLIISTYVFSFGVIDGLLLGLAISSTTMFSGCKGVLDGYEKFRGLVKYKILQSVLIYLLPAAVSYYSTSLTLFFAVIAIVRIVSAASLLKIEVLNTFGLDISEVEISEVKDYFRLGKWAFLSNTVSVVLSYLDRFLVVKILGSDSTAYYLTSVDVTNKASVVTGGVLQAGYRKLVQLNSKKGDYTSNWLYLFVLTLFALLFSMFWIFGEYGVAIWLGQENSLVFKVVLILIGSICFNSLAQISYYSLLAKFKQRAIGLIHSCEILFYIPLAVWLVLSFGVLGAATALLLRNTVDFLALRGYELWHGREVA